MSLSLRDLRSVQLRGTRPENLAGSCNQKTGSYVAARTAAARILHKHSRGHVLKHQD